jgi:hypothetical protein
MLARAHRSRCPSHRPQEFYALVGQVHRAGALQIITTRAAPDIVELSGALAGQQATGSPGPYTCRLERLSGDASLRLLLSKFQRLRANPPPPEHNAWRIAVDVCDGNPLLLHLVGGLLADPDAGVTPAVRARAGCWERMTCGSTRLPCNAWSIAGLGASPAILTAS